MMQNNFLAEPVRMFPLLQNPDQSEEIQISMIIISSLVLNYLRHFKLLTKLGVENDTGVEEDIGEDIKEDNVIRNRFF